MIKEPLKIVITPVRNEEWVLNAFLAHTSSWADYIIVADHHSTDRSREIAKSYKKVILIDNPTEEWYENEVRRMLLKTANNIQGDKIIFGLDADEFLSEGFEKTDGWKTILESPPNSIFCFRWLNLFDNFHTAQYENAYMEWACHFDDSVDIVKEYEIRENHAVHAARVPCIEADRSRYIMIDDIRFIHLARLYNTRTRNKLDFYQVVWADKNKQKYSPISMFREYTQYYPANLETLPNDINLVGQEGILNARIKQNDIGQHYVDEMIRIISRDGCIRKFKALFIWDNVYLQKAFPGVSESRPFYMKAVNYYLSKTQRIKDCLIIILIDKVLKKIYR